MKSSRPSSMIVSTSRDDFFEFQVIPEVGLRNESLEFLLGMPLNTVITMIQQNSLLKDINFTYSRKKPFERDICVALTREGVKLYFDAITQLLSHIDVDSPSSVILTYNKKVFSSPGNEATLEKIDEYFGSTHPGAYDDVQKLYVQSWRGLSFCFPNSGNVTAGSVPHVMSLKYDGSSQPKLARMTIFKGSSPNKIEDVMMPISTFCGQNRNGRVFAQFKENVLTELEITFTTQGGDMVSSLDSEIDTLELTKTIRFGDSVDAVLVALGAPSKVFYKSEDKMSIHRKEGKKQTLVQKPHFFFNYFSIGMDVLFDFTSKRVIKFVLHTNIPGHYDFGMYARCEFVIRAGADPMDITTKSKYTDIISVFHDPVQDEPRPVVSRRRGEQDPFGPTYLYGTDQFIVEVMDNNHISSVILYDKDL